MPLDVARRGTLDVRDPPLKAIVAANDNYEAGYHKGNAGGLDAIDTDLATGNIKNGITIFGKVGSADVQDISDATAVEAEVLAPETFYAVGGGIRTGTMPTVALAPGSSAYPAGYHAGAANLTAVDADLVTGSIKSGVTIFGVAGAATVQDIADADLTVAEAPTGKFFYAVTGGRKTGTGTQTLNPANEVVAAGYYAATTLSAVDADLAVGNIKSGVTIFGLLGTYSQALAEDILGSQRCTRAETNSVTSYNWFETMASGADYTIVTLTQAYDASSLAVGVGTTWAMSNTASAHKLRLYMDGVQVAESAYIPNSPSLDFFILMATRALSGSTNCSLRVHNYDAGSATVYIYGIRNNLAVDATVAVGSVKLV